MKVACFTVAALDYFPQQNQHFAGGNSLNQAIRIRQMGYETAFMGALGTDEVGDRLSGLLNSEKVDVSHLHRLEGKSATNRIFNDELGERFGGDDAWDGGVYETFLLSEADWKFMHDFDVWVTHANNPNFREALKRKPQRLFMGVDFLHFRDYELLEGSLDIVDVAYFGGTPDMADDLARMAIGRSGIIILTLGAEGSIAFVNDKRYIQSALPVDKVIDTTGCGDAFQAAFSMSYCQNKDVRAALLAGAEHGRKATQHHGGVRWNSPNSSI
jgi:sugar/nucleoside kinase (ribokinase family)